MTREDMRTIGRRMDGSSAREINPDSAEVSFVAHLDTVKNLVSFGFESNAISGKTWLFSICYDIAQDLLGIGAMDVLRRKINGLNPVVRITGTMEVR